MSALAFDIRLAANFVVLVSWLTAVTSSASAHVVPGARAATYTCDADFDAGKSVNLDHVAKHDELQLAGATVLAGTWTKIHDGGVLGCEWGTLAWHSLEPAGTRVLVEVRAADSQAGLAQKKFVTVQSGKPACGTGITGQFLEIRSTLTRQREVAATPILYDLSASGCDSFAGPSLNCPPDFTEIWSGGAATGQLAEARTGLATFVDTCTRGGVQLTYTDTATKGTTVGAPELVVKRLWRLTDDCGTQIESVQTITLLSHAGKTGALTMDVLPGRCPNAVNIRGSAPTPIALVGTWLHDVTAVDTSSLSLSRADEVGNTIALASLPIAFQDVTRPCYGELGDCQSFAGEGHLDVVISVPTWMLRRALSLDTLASGSRVELRLQGRLLDGTAFDVSDEITLK